MTSFKYLNLEPIVLKAIEELGYKSPTPIQLKAIPEALNGKDILGIAQTGTGKTASFTLPIISLLSKGRAKARMPRSLVLCPTRELAAQVAENFDEHAKNTKMCGKCGKIHVYTIILHSGTVGFQPLEIGLEIGFGSSPYK